MTGCTRRSPGGTHATRTEQPLYATGEPLTSSALSVSGCVGWSQGMREYLCSGFTYSERSSVLSGPWGTSCPKPTTGSSGLLAMINLSGFSPTGFMLNRVAQVRSLVGHGKRCVCRAEINVFASTLTTGTWKRTTPTVWSVEFQIHLLIFLVCMCSPSGDWLRCTWIDWG